MAQSRRGFAIIQKNDATGISPKRGMVKRAKRHSSHRDRQILAVDLHQRIGELHGSPTDADGLSLPG